MVLSARKIPLDGMMWYKFCVQTVTGSNAMKTTNMGPSSNTRLCIWCGKLNPGPLRLCEACDRFALALRLREAQARGLKIKVNGTEPDD